MLDRHHYILVRVNLQKAGNSILQVQKKAMISRDNKNIYLYKNLFIYLIYLQSDNMYIFLVKKGKLQTLKGPSVWSIMDLAEHWKHMNN